MREPFIVAFWGLVVLVAMVVTQPVKVGRIAGEAVAAFRTAAGG